MDTGLRFVSDRMLDIIITMLEKYKFILEVDKEGKLNIINNLESLCSYNMSMENIKEQLENNKVLANRESKFKLNYFEKYKDFECTGCKFDRCPKYYAVYVLYLKNKGLLLEKLKDREEYRNTEFKSDYFTFKWNVEGEIPEKTFKFAEEYFNRGLIQISSTLNEDGFIEIRMAHSCSMLSLCNYDFSKLPDIGKNDNRWSILERSKT